MRGTMWSVSGGCKIIMYLESQTPNFLLTVQPSSGQMMIKGHLLSSTATIKRFQIEKV